MRISSGSNWTNRFTGERVTVEKASSQGMVRFYPAGAFANWREGESIVRTSITREEFVNTYERAE